MISQVFQSGTINYSSIQPVLDYTKDKLTGVEEKQEPIKQLQLDVEECVRLYSLELKCTEGTFDLLIGFRRSISKLF